VVANTLDSIDFVEKQQMDAIPSANELLNKWADTSHDTLHEATNTMMCTAKPGIERVLALEVVLSTKRLYKRVEDAISDSVCGPVMRDVPAGIEQDVSYETGQFSF
jgi:hypothetical protein